MYHTSFLHLRINQCLGIFPWFGCVRTLYSCVRAFTVSYAPTQRATPSNVKMMVVAWFFAVLFVTPAVCFAKLTPTCLQWPDIEQFINYPTTINRCIWNNWAVLSICVAHLLLNTISFLLNFFMYIKIVRKLYERKRNYGEGHMLKVRSHVARMLGINAVIFFMCLSPYQLINIADVVFILTEEHIFQRTCTFYWFGSVVLRFFSIQQSTPWYT